MEENFWVAQKGGKRAARGAYKESPKKMGRDKVQTKKKKKKKKKASRGAHGQVMKKTSGWHRREKKERQGASEESP